MRIRMVPHHTAEDQPLLLLSRGVIHKMLPHSQLMLRAEDMPCDRPSLAPEQVRVGNLAASGLFALCNDSEALCREPLTYKEFMFKLPDDITPEEAQKEYQRYLAEYWGSEIRAEFQAKKNEGW